MYVATVPNRKSPPAILLRESYRDGSKVKTRTLANVSHWPAAQIEALRAQTYDCVVLDLGLWDFDGDELLKRIEQDPGSDDRQPQHDP